MTWYEDASKEWGSLGGCSITRSAISYEPKINSKNVQGKNIGAGVR